MGFEHGAAGSGSKYTNHSAMLPTSPTPLLPLGHNESVLAECKGKQENFQCPFFQTEPGDSPFCLEMLLYSSRRIFFAELLESPFVQILSAICKHPDR